MRMRALSARQERKMMIIALDPGFGNTKVCVDGRTAVVQSAVARPKDVGRATTGLRASHRVKRIEIPTQATFVVGPWAWEWGEPIGSLDYSAIDSLGRQALFYAALGELLEPDEYKGATLVIGLPVPLLEDTARANSIMGRLRKYKGEHSFYVDSSPDPVIVQIDRVKVLPQPVGAYTDWMLTDDLGLRRGTKSAEVGIIDLGMNTLDLYAMVGGRAEPRFIGGSKVGVRRLLEDIDGRGRDIEELDASLRAGRLNPGRNLASWMTSIIGEIERSWGDFARFDAIIPTGGGVLVARDQLNRALLNEHAAIYWPDDPVTANVKGLWKWMARKA